MISFEGINYSDAFILLKFVQKLFIEDKSINHVFFCHFAVKVKQGKKMTYKLEKRVKKGGGDQGA